MATRFHLDCQIKCSKLLGVLGWWGWTIWQYEIQICTMPMLKCIISKWTSWGFGFILPDNLAMWNVKSKSASCPFGHSWACSIGVSVPKASSRQPNIALWHIKSKLHLATWKFDNLKSKSAWYPFWNSVFQNGHHADLDFIYLGNLTIWNPNLHQEWNEGERQRGSKREGWMYGL